MSIDMCEEVIVEIFSRLPSKSLVRFRSVSKSLCARISSPSFIKLHTLQSPKLVMMINRVGFIGTNICTLYPQSQFPNIGIPIMFPFANRLSHIAGSCNGLLCVYNHSVIYLWNPSIRRQVTIHEPWDGTYSSRDASALGFGFDSISEDYKVLRVSNASSRVYTLKSRSWREIAPPVTPFTFESLEIAPPAIPPFMYERFQPCLLNGVLHWAVARTELDVCDYFYYRHYYIMTFDLRSEVFSKIELPEPTWEINLVTIIRGCLAVISPGHHGQIWIWVRTATSWSLAYKLDGNPFETAVGVLQITPNDELLYIAQAKGILAYNLGTNEISRVVDFSEYWTSLDGMCLCEESLQLLDTGDLCDEEY